jgi:SET domain-containing protein
MKVMLSFSLLATVAMSFGLAMAEDKTDCAVTYTRAACPGKEAESYAKCDGKQSCVKYVPAKSAEECSAAAAQACSNDRPMVTESKVINASYKGKPVKSSSGKADFCVDYAKRATEFNQCSKK